MVRRLENDLLHWYYAGQTGLQKYVAHPPDDVRTVPIGERQMVKIKVNMDKISWSGSTVLIQSRIRLPRSFDERGYSYLGYVLRGEGTIGDEPGKFIITIGKAAQAKHCFHAGMGASGQAVPVPDPRLETAGFYKACGLKIIRIKKPRTLQMI